ncbi:MAG: phospholipid carrier-dependent glycosyltransferase, partial [Clostridia bacterium]|nr:phospholipid carrier-dependent glycosyltransferase [Clostridia bacterium]
MGGYRFSVGILTKPQMIIFAPLLFFWLLFDSVDEWREKREFNHIKSALSGVLISLIIAIVLMIPIFGFDIKRFIGLYKDAAAQYPYASLNAANIFGAFGKNWASLSETFLGITYQNWGVVGIILTSALVGAGTFYAKNRLGGLILSSFTVLGIFMFAHTMHERYMFPLVLLTLLTFIYTRDKRMLYGFFASSVLSFINSGVILLDNEGIIKFSQNSFIALSWVHVIFFVCLVYVFAKMLVLGDRKYINKVIPKIMSIKKSDKRVRYTKIDFLLVGILTLVYAAFAFANLGSTNTPQTGYYPKENGETIILDFGEEKYFDRINLYAGWIDRRDKDSEVLRDVYVSFGAISEDGRIVFENETEITLKSVFCWNGFFADQTGRFIKISVDEGDFYINEIACFDENKNLLTPAQVTSENETASLIFDEQDKAVYEYTWYDGTYFDEIYHPRTAYEYINGILPYENTHPPLGKLIISLGMMLFGVTPFGWRFFGALTGVLMVPLSYMLSKELLKETRWALASCFLFTFDFMHLAQTRLATIDSYTAFFVMAMFYFMLRYVKLSFYDTDFKKTLVPLFLSGVCFGLGAAVKWQGIYAGFGLAVMFFASLLVRYIEFKAAKDGRLVAESEKVEKCFYKNTLKTLNCAIVFFVVVPFIIYFLAYLPIILSDNADISYFWENQKSMLSYHSNLTETHPFGSPWWSWPLDLRPLYAYNPNWDFVSKEFAQGISSFGNPLVWWCCV